MCVLLTDKKCWCRSLPGGEFCVVARGGASVELSDWWVSVALEPGQMETATGKQCHANANQLRLSRSAH